jgi:two-component system alkaline phosphatase synthesis response regulator PhoP
MSARILIIDDTVQLSRAVEDGLHRDGYSATVVSTGHEALELLSRTSFHLILLDLRLPDVIGLEICKKLREERDHTPIIIVTALRSSADKILGLKTGAEDYLTKSFDIRGLLARIEVQLRNVQVPVSNTSVHEFGEIRVDLRKAEVTRSGKVVDLSAREFTLLRHLIQHPEILCTRDELLDKVWGRDVNLTIRTVDVHIAWLRRKLEISPAHPQYILTVYGLGYKFTGYRQDQ